MRTSKTPSEDGVLGQEVTGALQKLSIVFTVAYFGFADGMYIQLKNVKPAEKSII